MILAVSMLEKKILVSSFLCLLVCVVLFVCSWVLVLDFLRKEQLLGGHCDIVVFLLSTPEPWNQKTTQLFRAAPPAQKVTWGTQVELHRKLN